MKSLKNLCLVAVIASSISACSMHDQHRQNSHDGMCHEGMNCKGMPCEGMNHEDMKEGHCMQMDMSKDEMMKSFQAYSTPGAYHQKLKALEGKWNYTSTFWMKPGETAEKSKGTAENKLIYGGRFLQMNAKGTAMGQPFEGQGFVGYDNIAKEYTSFWFDNMGTGVMTAKGNFNEASNSIEEYGSFSCPMVNGAMSMRGIWSIIDKNHLKYETFVRAPNGREYKNMELEYTRK